MHPNLTARRLLVGVVALMLITAGTVKAQPLDRSGSVIVPVGGAVRLQMKTKKLIKVVFVTKPGILAVEADAANPAYVILRGAAPGTATIELTDVDGVKETYEVVVQTDIDLLRNILKRAVPTASVEVIPFGASNSVVLSGYVAHAEDIDPIIRITATVLGTSPLNVVNAMTVAGVHQVQLDVTVCRVDRTKMRSRGFNFVVNGSTVSTGSILGTLATSAGTAGNNTVATGVGIIPGAASALPTAVANIVFGVIPANFQGLLEALKTEQLAKTIAEPKLVTQSGRPARFLSGGQQATLSASAGITGPGVTYQDIGTELEFLPIVYGNGKIYLEVAPRLRSVNQALGITFSGTSVPGFDDQQVKTSVVLESGQTFAIGGLIQTTMQATRTMVPVVGEIPFIGPFFSQASSTEDETELVVLVTPHLVDPMDCNQLPKRLPGMETRPPDDFEMYLEGILEAPRGQRNVFENKHYKAAWKNSPTAPVYPCGMQYPGGGGKGGCANGTCGAQSCTTNAAPANVAPATAAPAAPAKTPMVLNVAPGTPAELPAATIPKESLPLPKGQ
jgi:pilus assembly protein CpaC